MTLFLAASQAMADVSFAFQHPVCFTILALGGLMVFGLLILKF